MPPTFEKLDPKTASKFWLPPSAKREAKKRFPGARRPRSNQNQKKKENKT
jgi:hypothetical protein